VNEGLQAAVTDRTNLPNVTITIREIN